MADSTAAAGQHGLEFRAFDLATGLPAARAMAEASWRRDYAKQAYLDLFDEPFWALNFRAPGAFGLRPIAWGVWDGTELVGFAGGVPRRVRIGGRALDTYLVGWLTVHADHRRRGIATLLYRGAHEELHAKHDGAFMFLDKGHASTLMFDRLERERPTHRIIAHARVALRILRDEEFWEATPLRLHERAYLWARHRRFRPRPAGPGVREYRPADLPGCLALTRRIAADVTREWEEAELSHHLAASDVSRTVVLESAGVIRGFVNLIVVRQLGLRPCKVAFLETVALGTLGADDAARLVDAALSDARDRGCVSAIEFDRAYYPPSVLRDARFFFAPRDLYLSYLVGRERLDHLQARSFYLDWR